MSAPIPKPTTRSTAPGTSGDWPSVRLHVVSGKGGTGKTTVAAALALALASGGRRVLLIEVEGRQGIAQLFDTAPLPYAEKQVAVAPGGGDVFALAVDAESALLEYLELFYNMRRAGSALRKLGAIDFATTIAPGVRDVLLTGKAIEAVKRGVKDGRPAYDAVVLDAPPTGRISRFLNVSDQVADLARIGPIKSQATTVMAVIKSPRTAVHLVTLLEEMPVQEVLDGVADLKATGLPIGGIFINMLREPRLSDADMRLAIVGKLSRNAIAVGLKKASVAPHGTTMEGTVAALLAEATDHAERINLERAEHERLRMLNRPTYELPLLPGGIDLAGLYAFAIAMRRQGVGSP